MKITAIGRDPLFSPGNRENDSAIFWQCIDELRAGGHSVNVYEESQSEQWGRDEGNILHMARGRAAREMLAKMEERAIPVINSVAALNNCARKTAYETMIRHGIPCPASVHVSTEIHAKAPLPFPALWLKRTDSCTQRPEDVVFVEGSPAYRSALRHFFERGIAEVQASEHHEGIHVKFYGVGHNRFFRSFRTDPGGRPRDETNHPDLTARSSGYDEAALEEIAFAAADALQLMVWGGDAIIDPDGRIGVIDMNDFPSFRPCREAAAKAIAQCVTSSLQHGNKKS
jgi:hypothetical protein